LNNSVFATIGCLTVRFAVATVVGGAFRDMQRAANGRSGKRKAAASRVSTFIPPTAHISPPRDHRDTRYFDVESVTLLDGGQGASDRRCVLQRLSGDSTNDHRFRAARIDACLGSCGSESVAPMLHALLRDEYSKLKASTVEVRCLYTPQCSMHDDNLTTAGSSH
jgi:hypothetical protein